MLPNAGYVPGYRTYPGFSLAPNVPRVGAFPGNITPGYAAPMPPTQWTFKWSGFMNDSFQSSIGRRMVTGPDQTTTVFHIPPQTVDEYASFLGTNTMPGQWVQITMAYGTPTVSANVNLSTWNPTDPTTYYQIGSQNFIQNAYLQYLVPPLGDWKLRAMAGYFYTNYGSLAQYGLGMYTNAIVGLVRGVGQDVTAEYRISPTLTLLLDEGFMGNRNGKTPDNVIGDGGNGGRPQPRLSRLLGGAHPRRAGHRRTDDLQAQHALFGQLGAGRSRPVPGRLDPGSAGRHQRSLLRQPGLPARSTKRTSPTGTLRHRFRRERQPPAWGYLGFGGSYTKGAYAAPLHGLSTFGGEGQWLADRWWGSGTSAAVRSTPGGSTTRRAWAGSSARRRRSAATAPD